MHERALSLLHTRQEDARSRFVLWPFKSRQSFLVNHFSGCHSDERGLGEVQWYWDAVTALSMWILTLRYGDVLRLWTETAMRWDAHAHTHHYCSQRSLADHTVPGSVYGGDKRPKGGENHVGMNEGQRGFVSEWLSVQWWMLEKLRWSFAFKRILEGCYFETWL